MLEIFVGRQPIYNRQLKVVGYELLFRSHETDHAEFIDGDRATSQVMLDSFMEIGLERLVRVGRRELEELLIVRPRWFVRAVTGDRASLSTELGVLAAAGGYTDSGLFSPGLQVCEPVCPLPGIQHLAPTTLARELLPGPTFCVHLRAGDT